MAGAALKPCLLGARRVWRKLGPREDVFSPVDLTATGQEASDLIRHHLESKTPTMVGRFGSTELTCIRNYLGVTQSSSFFRRSVLYITGKGGPLWWEGESLENMIHASGFFPPSFELLERFCVRMLEDMQLVDILGSWMSWEKLVERQLRQAVRVNLVDLQPYRHANPWSEALAGKTVLVVHPFTRTIESQYRRRSALFEDQRTLPEFELKTLTAVQSIGHNETPYASWFDALSHMEDAMSDMEFDVALIGAGAYGFPLAAHAKRLGRIGIHLGGATQLLFGIRGKRWDEYHELVKFYNESWVRPAPDERPPNYASIEGGSYW